MIVAAVVLGLSAMTTARVYVRVNQVGYLPDAPKAAVVCSLDPISVDSFEVRDARNRRVLALPARAGESFGACRVAFRLDFSRLRTPGRYRIAVPFAEGMNVRVGMFGDVAMSPEIRINANVYRGAADTLLYYMRQQRSDYNPVFGRRVHQLDGIIVDDPARQGHFIDVSGGWADAADYLQYVTTSAHATFMMLMTARDFPRAIADDYKGSGIRGSNRVTDVLDEARHGLTWLAKMFRVEPGDTAAIRAGAIPRMYNQLADDRDHSFWDLPYTDSSDYGWGRGGYRPVYPCTGKPQGLFNAKNSSSGYSSTAGKFASAFALAAQLYRTRDAAFARAMRDKAIIAFEVGLMKEGPCQTAPGRGAYFYEEDSWADDMELAAAELYALTGERRYVEHAHRFAHIEPVTPWMGADTANHYQWFPWHNNGHYEAHRAIPSSRDAVPAFYRTGLERVIARADNAFKLGIPFIWCSNNLAASFATQAYLYRRMTGDSRFREYEQAAIDWLLGVNPWGTSMIIGYPNGGVWPRDPHSVVYNRLGIQYQLGGLVDGPVYRSIFQNLQWVRLHQPDEFAPFNNGRIVYHDDMGDYSTNEPIMDGTANLTYIFAAYASGGR